MHLYTAHLLSLSGFYASDVYAVAESLEQALERIMEGVRAYVAERCEEYGCLPGIVPTDDDEDWPEELTKFYARVETEAREKLAPVSGHAIVHVRI